MLTSNLETLASDVQRARAKVADYKRGYLLGKLDYDDLADAGRELSNALFLYARAKFPDVKAKRIPYQAIIR